MQKVWTYPIVVFCSFALMSCSMHVKEARAVDESITVRDPMLSKMLSFIDEVNLQAEGKFAPGTYQVKTKNGKSLSVKVPDNNAFKLTLHLTLHGSNVIDTKAAEGTFETTNPIFVANLPAPTNIQFDHGKISADVDLVRTVSATVINMLQGSAEKDDSSHAALKLVEKLRISKAIFTLKKSAVVQLNDFKINLQSGKLVLENANFQNKSDFRGTWRVVATINEATKPEQKNKVGVSLRDAFAELAFAVERKENILTLHLISESRNVLEMKSLKLSRGANHLIAKNALATVKTANVKHTMNASDDSIDSSAQLLLDNCEVQAKSPSSAISGKLAVKQNALIDLDIEGSKELLEVNVPRAKASDVSVEIIRPGGSVSLALRQASIDSFLFRKDGQIVATLSKGEVSPASIHWVADKKRIDVVMQPGTKIRLEHPITAGSTTDGSMHGKNLPFNLKSGRIAITNGKNKLALENISGEVVVSVEDSDIKLRGNITARAGLQPLLGIPDLMVSVEKISLDSKDKHVKVHLTGCHLKVPQSEINNAIRTNLASGKTFALKRPVFEKMKWRYRNMMLETVTIKQPSLSTLTFDKKNHFNIACNANLTAKGTVERYNLKINPLSKESRGWIQKTWSGQGTVAGKTGCTISFVPGVSLKDSALKYDADARFAIPDDLTIDWSKVDEGLLGRSEQALIKEVVSHSGAFSPAEGIPLKSSGSIKLFKHPDDRLGLVRISNVLILPSKQNLDLSFTADAHL